MIFTTNKPLAAWGRVLHDSDLAQAILDRVLERGRHLELRGESYRTRHAPLDLTPAPASASSAPARISGDHRPEFPEPTSNPDSFEHLHVVTVQGGSASVEIQSLLPLNEVILLPDFFAVLDIVSLAADPSTGEALRDGNCDLIKYNFGNTNWVSLMARNTGFIIQPEEILAGNFATLIEWRSAGVLPTTNPSRFPVNDVDLLTAIEDVLASGCGD